MEEREEEIRKQLSAMFLDTMPQNEKDITNRQLYYILQAYWYALKIYSCVEKKKRRDDDISGLCTFANWLTQKKNHFTFRQIREFFYEYLYRIPVCGAVIFNKEKTHWLTVRSANGKRYGHPKGKIEGKETDAECAIREVKEETGLNIEPYINERVFAEATVRHKRVKFYIIDTMPEPETLKCRPQNSDEIAECSWLPVNEPRRSYTPESQAILRYVRPSILRSN